MENRGRKSTRKTLSAVSITIPNRTTSGREQFRSLHGLILNAYQYSFGPPGIIRKLQNGWAEDGKPLESNTAAQTIAKTAGNTAKKRKGKKTPTATQSRAKRRRVGG
jgi:hypothetical protein